MIFLISALMVPEEVTIIPNFFLMRGMGMVDSHWPLILLPTFGPERDGDVRCVNIFWRCRGA